MTRRWQKTLAEKGWVAPLWPRDHGGPGWSPAQVYIFESECARAGAPSLSPLGIRMVGPVIIGFGTAAQRAHYLPRILSGEDYWCQGYSEPGAGSDLASLKTRAERDGDHYVLNGSKIWTTHAHHANRMFALVRTSDGKRKQDGISFLLIDMNSPGIKVRPIITLGGDHEVNQVFFDDVRVPVANGVGDEGAGWSYGKYLLEFERGSGISALRLRASLARVRAIAIARGADAGLLDKLDETEMDIDALEMTELRVLSSLKSGQPPGHVSSVLKLRMSELTQAITSLGVQALGAEALAFETERPLYGLNHPPILDKDALPVVPRYLGGRAFTIFGGTAEVQREILAKPCWGCEGMPSGSGSSNANSGPLGQTGNRNWQPASESPSGRLVITGKARYRPTRLGHAGIAGCLALMAVANSFDANDIRPGAGWEIKPWQFQRKKCRG